MEDAPGDIECDQDNHEPEKNRLVVLERKKAQRDSRKDKRPNEKWPRLYAAPSQKNLLDKTAKITRIESNGV